MTVAYDAGALIAADNGDRTMWADHLMLLKKGRQPITTAPVVAQVSRTTRQAQLHRLLTGCEVINFTADDAREVGQLLADSATADVVDAHLVCVAGRHRALIFTSDGNDIAHLSSHLDRPVTHHRL